MKIEGSGQNDRSCKWKNATNHNILLAKGWGPHTYSGNKEVEWYERVNTLNIRLNEGIVDNIIVFGPNKSAYNNEIIDLCEVEGSKHFIHLK